MIWHYALWREVVLLAAAAPFVYYLLAIFAALRFFGGKQGPIRAEYNPPASLLKPVRGVDFGSYENFTSFCRLDYPEYEILFAVNDESRSEEHTSELQSRFDLVCRLLLEKKKKN